jgi:hypothetical protein
MYNVLDSSVVDSLFDHHSAKYSTKTLSIDKLEQRLVGAESGYYVQIEGHAYPGRTVVLVN